MRSEWMVQNEAVRREFERVTGRSNRFEFIVWASASARAAMLSVHADPRVASERWAALTREEQRAHLFVHLRSLPSSVVAA